MRTLSFDVFEGHNDDSLKADGCKPGEPNEIPIYGNDGAVLQLRVDGRDDGLHIFAKHTIDGWVIGVALLDEGKPLPDWDMTINTSSNGYSPRLTIEAPDNSVLNAVCPRREG